MNTVSVDDVLHIINALWLAGFVGAFVACYIGGVMGALSGRGVLLFLRRRCRTWRRFSRAFDRTVWGE